MLLAGRDKIRKNRKWSRFSSGLSSGRALRRCGGAVSEVTVRIDKTGRVRENAAELHAKKTVGPPDL